LKTEKKRKESKDTNFATIFYLLKIFQQEFYNYVGFYFCNFFIFHEFKIFYFIFVKIKYK